MIGKYTNKFAELGDVRRLKSWVELYSLLPGKRTVTKSNMGYFAGAKLWMFSPNSGMYFLLEGVEDNANLRKLIDDGRMFLVKHQEHEDALINGMTQLGKYYNVMLNYSEYVDLVEYLLDVEEEQGKRRDERSEAKLSVLKNKVKQILNG